jgi:hypothetical protein
MVNGFAVNDIQINGPNEFATKFNGHLSFDGTINGRAINYESINEPNRPSIKTVSAGNIVIVNALREVPPLAGYPNADRSSSFREVPTLLVQKSWVHAQLVRYLISGTSDTVPVHLYAPSGARVTSDSSITVNGWNIEEYSVPVDNNEISNPYNIRKADKLYAQHVPWHGWYCSISESVLFSALSYDVSMARIHANLLVDDSSIGFLTFSSNVSPLAFDTPITTSTVMLHGSIKWDRLKQQRLWIVYMKESPGYGVERIYTDNEGATYSVATVIKAGAKWPVIVQGKNNVQFIYYVDGTTIKGKIYDAKGNLIQGEFTAVASGVDDEAISADESITIDGIWRMVILYGASGSLTRIESNDGEVFT